MTRSTLIAVAVFAALGLLFFATREPQVAVGIKRLTIAPVKADQLTSLRLGALTLTSENGAWTVGRDGKRWPADPGQVRALTQALADLKAADFVTDKPEKHAELEVDAAKGLALEASTASGVVRALVLGKSSKSGGAYVREAKSNEVFAAPGALGWTARQPLTAWRLKTIATTKREALKRVTLAPASGEGLTLVTEGAEVKLEATPEPGYRFDEGAAKRLVDQLTNLSAQDFSEEPVTPAFTVTLSLEDGKTKTLTLGGKRPDGTVSLVVDGDPQTYVLSGGVADQLQQTREGLRDLRLLDFKSSEATRATLTASGKRVVLEKKNDAWTVVEPKTLPPGFEFDAPGVEAQLRQLGTLRALRMAPGVTEAKAGLTKPSGELAVTTRDGKTHRIVVGAKEGGDVYARGQDPFVVVAPAALLSQLERGVELFKRQPPPQAMSLDDLPPELRAQLEAQLKGQR